MSGLSGIVNLNRKISSEFKNARLMAEVQMRRGGSVPQVEDCGSAIFACTERILGEELPLSREIGGVKYTICFDGLIYNAKELETELKKERILLDSPSDAELVLAAYIKWGVGCVQRLNGIFAFSIWNQAANELFLARDRFGIKPLYYTILSDTLIFASEIKGILAHPKIDAVLDKKGICEVLGLGPAQVQGSGIFKDIYEILPSNCATYNKNGFNTYCYWRLESKKFEESFDECLENAKKLTFSAINSQLEEKGRRMCYFLSGGLDSSAIVAMAAKKYGYGINTFSLKYSGNDEFFKPTEYQPSADDDYIRLMSETYNTKHHTIEVDNDALFSLLTDAVDARDMPGMADVDSSLYFLCREMGNEFSGAISGECADEVFGGYPWFHRKEDFDAKIFPWAKNIDMRRNLVNPSFLSPDEISQHIYSSYDNSVLMTARCADDNEEDKRRREIAHLNLNWFMFSLGARSERIGMNCGVEIRMPFCDHKLVEYIWNVPWNFKAYNEREKGLLRMVFNEILPEDILWRKKSPFPKTHNPEYEDMVAQRVVEIFSDKNSAVCDLINEEYIFELMSKPSDYAKPWFGQLMATPQLYGYIIQLDYWLKKYGVKIKI